MSAVLRNEACRKVFLKARESLDQKMESAVRSMIGYSKHSESDSLGELGFGSCLLLALISALSNSELMLSAALLELSASYSPLKSSHFTAWLVEDYAIDVRVIQKALEQLFRIDRLGLFCVPGHMRKLLLELARQLGIHTDSFPNEDLGPGSEEDAEANRINTQENAEANRINTEENAEVIHINTEENVEVNHINTEENVEVNHINTEENVEDNSITADENVQEDHAVDSAVNEGACSSARVDNVLEKNVASTLRTMRRKQKKKNKKNATGAAGSLSTINNTNAINSQEKNATDAAGSGRSVNITNAENSQKENVAGASGAGGAIININAENLQDENIAGASGNGGAISNINTENSQEKNVVGASWNGGAISSINSENLQNTESPTQADINTMVINAVIADNSTALEELAGGGAALSMTADDGQSLLHLAAKGGCINTAKTLIQLGARLNREDRQWLTPLHKAVQADNVQMIQLLIEAGANTSCKLFGGETMLMFAIANSSFSAASLFLNYGMHINDKNNRRDTFLHTVLNEYKNTEQSLTLEKRKLSSSKIHNIVKFITDHNGDINITNASGETALHIAAGIADAEVVKSLLAAGAVADVRNNVGDTPLHIATRISNVAGVICLLEAGAVVDVQNNIRDTPLHIATSSNNYVILEKLVSSSCSSIAIINASGKSPLHLAVSCGFIDCLEILLESSENLEIEDNSGYTPFCMATENGDMSIVEMLCKKNVKINHAIKIDRKTPLHLAVEKGHSDIVKLLLEEGADVQAKASKFIRSTVYRELSPLHYAAMDGQLSIVESLIERGADLEAKDDYGSTPLHWAARGGHLSTVQELLARGANLKVYDRYMWTPLETATRNSKHDVASFLRSKTRSTSPLIAMLN